MLINWKKWYRKSKLNSPSLPGNRTEYLCFKLIFWCKCGRVAIIMVILEKLSHIIANLSLSGHQIHQCRSDVRKCSDNPYNEGIFIESARTHWYCIKGTLLSVILCVQSYNRLIIFNVNSLSVRLDVKKC
jgi:hypothetical protein